MTPLTVIALLLFVASVFFARSQERTAFNRLSTTHQHSLAKAQPGGVASLIAIVLGILVYVLAKKTYPESRWPALGFVLFLLVFYSVISAIHLKKLKQLNIEAAYVKRLVVGRGVQAVALLLLLGLLLSRSLSL